MKKFFFLFALLGMGLFLGSCSDEDEETPDFLTADINGTAFTAETINTLLDNSLGAELVFISGSTAEYAISINIPTSAAANTTTAIDENDLGILFVDSAGNSLLTIGEVTLTTNDTEGRIMAGTFTFNAMDDVANPTNEHQITNGAFKVTY